MTPEEAKAILAKSEGTDESAILPPIVLKHLSAADIPEGIFIEIGAPKDGIIHLEWSGRLFKERERIVAEADYTWTRKYWYDPIGLEQYLDLVRRAVEVRSRTRGDTN